MKAVIIVSVAALIIALAMPLIMTASRALPEPETTPTATQEPQKAMKDDDITFTVLTGGSVKTASLSDWLPGVIAGEMPALFDEEALKAQAVAARTYIINAKSTGTAAHPEADICDNSACCMAHLTETQMREKWGDNYDAYLERISEAIRETDGEYLTYGGEAIQAVFHSSSAGRTEDSSALWSALPYLVSVSSPETGEDVPNYVSEVEVSVTDFAATLRAADKNPDLSGTPDTWVGELTLDESGRVETADIGGTSISGAELRTLFALRSTAFTLDYVDGAFLFTVTGSGHGVGMSQYGANVMAKNGSSYQDILAHYYPGTTLMS